MEKRLWKISVQLFTKIEIQSETENWKFEEHFHNWPNQNSKRYATYGMASEEYFLDPFFRENQMSIVKVHAIAAWENQCIWNFHWKWLWFENSKSGLERLPHVNIDAYWRGHLKWGGRGDIIPRTHTTWAKI